MNIGNTHTFNINNKGAKMTNSNSLIDELRLKLSSENDNVAVILSELELKNSDFIKMHHGIYAYKNYYIIHGLSEYFANDIEGYKIANKTGVKSAPNLIDVIDCPEQEIVIILQSPSREPELHNFNENIDRLSLVERLQILDEFKTMLNHDYINEEAANSPNHWKLSSDNKLVLLLWNNLRKVTDPKEKIAYLTKIKEYLRINNDNPQHIFCVY